MTYVEFQAVLLAGGRGTRFPELTGDRPKCLLPVGPFPLIYYPLQMLHRHGFQELIVVVVESQRQEIQQAVEKLPLKLKIEYATIPSDQDFGTADALRHIYDRLVADLVIVSCDAITNVSLFPLFNCFRKTNASVVVQLFKGGMELDAVIPGPKSKNKQDRDLIGVQPVTQRLTFLASTSDFEEIVPLSKALMHRYGKFTMHSRMVDSHIYVIKKWVVDYLHKNTTISTLKGELIPFIVKKQLSRPVQHTVDSDKPMSIVNVNTNLDDVFQYITQTDLEQKITETSLFNDSVHRKPFNDDIIRCYAVSAEAECFGIRVNTINAFCAANQKIFTLWPQLFDRSAPELVSPASNIKSTQMTDCAVAENTTISEKTSLKNCILGPNCTVKPKTRISNSVVMNGVVIEEGVVIENCIIGDKATIRTGCVLKHCLIGPNFDVTEGSNMEKVHLTNADGYMEIE